MGGISPGSFYKAFSSGLFGTFSPGSYYEPELKGWRQAASGEKARLANC
jgi:hypothetical protein